MSVQSIATTINSQCNLNTAGTTYVLTGNTVVSNVVAPFNVTAGGIIFEGSGFTITVSGTPNFEGLFNASLTVRNVSHAITGTTSLKSGVGQGWFFKPSTNGGTSINCTNYAEISSPYAGAFFSANCSYGVASNCINYGNIASFGGGIFGHRNRYNTADNCINYGVINEAGGGIFGSQSQNLTVINCQNRSQSRSNSTGGIFGTTVADATAYNCISTTSSICSAFASGGAIYGDGANRCLAINCTSSEGPYIGPRGGGIFGYLPIESRAFNCINRTTISGSPTDPAYGIFAFGSGGGGVIATNCYNIGVITNGGAIGISSDAINCYTNNGTFAGSKTITNCASNAGTWSDASASTALTGDPSTYPGLGTDWASTAPNTPFVLLMTVSIAVPNLTITNANALYSLTSNSIVSNNISPLTSATPVVFDGNGYTITISGVPRFAGLFGTNVTVRNLSLASSGGSTSFIGPGQDSASGWFFRHSTSGGTASNCRNYGDFTVNYMGGFFGASAQNCTAISCTNTPHVYAQLGGGIFGQYASNCTVSGCINNGPVNNDYTGGILGARGNSCTVTNCTNNGICGNAQTGGIGGRETSNCTITNCTNNGDIEAVDSGGILGSYATNSVVTNCTNNGNIGGQRSGGIFGSNAINSTGINCTNIGNRLISAYNSGGIFGTVATGCVASNCIGASVLRPGGGAAIFGSNASSSTAINCTCSDGQTITDYNGGIFAFGAANCSAFFCINRTPIAGNTLNPGQGNTGGIFAEGGGGNFASNCYNMGAITNPEFNFGILAYIGDNKTVGVNGTASNCYTTNGGIGPAGGTNCSSNSDGVWSDITATASRNGGNGLTGPPYANPDATTSAIFPTLGSVWYSTGLNTPFLLSATIPPCFVAGTRIMTPTGYKCVETLKDHDEVVTSDGRTVSIQVYNTTIETTDEDTAPFVIPKDAFGLNNPDEDLHVSGKHIIRDGRGVWQAPMYLSCARQYGVGSPMTYYHIECPDYFHDDLIANGAVVESFRNKQGTSEVSYEYSKDLRGYVRVMEALETGFPDKHVLHDTSCC